MKIFHGTDLVVVVNVVVEQHGANNVFVSIGSRNEKTILAIGPIAALRGEITTLSSPRS